MKFIQVLPFIQWLPQKTDELDKVELLIAESEVMYLNIDQIKYISPIGETGRTIIKLVDNDEILSIEPLHKILDKLKNAK
jgi:hypothetical protein